VENPWTHSRIDERRIGFRSRKFEPIARIGEANDHRVELRPFRTTRYLREADGIFRNRESDVAFNFPLGFECSKPRNAERSPSYIARVPTIENRRPASPMSF
jgi:hypothetical protein